MIRKLAFLSTSNYFFTYRLRTVFWLPLRILSPRMQPPLIATPNGSDERARIQDQDVNKYAKHGIGR